MEHAAYKKMKTRLLIERCLEKSFPAWGEFARRYGPLIEFSAKRALSKYPHTGINESVKDVRQNILTSLWSDGKLAEIKNRQSIKYWLVIISRNAAIDHLRRQEKNILIKDGAFFEKLPMRETVDEKESQNTRYLKKKIKDAYKFFAPKEKIIFNLYFEKRLKAKEIAEMLNIAIGNVTSAAAKIRKKIHRKI